MSAREFTSPYAITPVPGDETDAIRTVFFDPRDASSIGVEWRPHVLTDYVLKWCTRNPTGRDGHAALVITCALPPRLCNNEAAGHAWHQAARDVRHNGSPLHIRLLHNPHPRYYDHDHGHGSTFSNMEESYGSLDDPTLVAAFYDGNHFQHFGEIAWDMIHLFTMPLLQPASDAHFQWKYLEDRIARGGYLIKPDIAPVDDRPYEACFLNGRTLTPSVYRIEHRQAAG